MSSQVDREVQMALAERDRARRTLEVIRDTVRDPAGAAPDLAGRPGGWELLAKRLGDLADQCLRTVPALGRKTPAAAPGLSGEQPVAGPAGPSVGDVGGVPPGFDVPDPGRFDWQTRREAPGLDESAVEALAVASGYHRAGADPVAGAKWAGGSLAEFMAHAIATSYDRLGCYLAGTRAMQPAEVREFLGLLAFGWAGCKAAAFYRELFRTLLAASRSEKLSAFDDAIERARKVLGESEPEKGGGS